MPPLRQSGHTLETRLTRARLVHRVPDIVRDLVVEVVARMVGVAGTVDVGREVAMGPLVHRTAQGLIHLVDEVVLLVECRLAGLLRKRLHDAFHGKGAQSQTVAEAEQVL